MDRGEKRSFDDMENPASVEEYVYSPSELRTLETWTFKRPGFEWDDEHDMNTKMAALKATSFTVSIVSFSGDEMVSQGCGTIMEADDNNNFVLTSLNVIRKPTKANMVENKLADNLKIVVGTPDKRTYLAEIFVTDFHYNLLALTLKSKVPLSAAKIIKIDEDFGIDRSFQLRPHISKLKPGDSIIAVGRYFSGSLHFMAAPGTFSMDRPRDSAYDCRELLSSTCDITRCGDGAPVVNLSGNVAGMQFYELNNTNPFMPINIISKWWSHYRKYKELRHPSYGFEARNFFLSNLETVESVTTCFPKISNGVLVDKVHVGSYAESAGLCINDVITKCDGKSVKGFLELWEHMWEKVGDMVVLEVARVKLGITLSISMMVGEDTSNKLNTWPRYDFK